MSKKKEKKKVKLKKKPSGVEERLKKIAALGDQDDSDVKKVNEQKLEKYHFRQNWDNRLSLREQKQSERRGPMRVIKYRTKPSFKKGKKA